MLTRPPARTKEKAPTSGESRPQGLGTTSEDMAPPSAGQGLRSACPVPILARPDLGSRPQIDAQRILQSRNGPKSRKYFTDQGPLDGLARHTAGAPERVRVEALECHGVSKAAGEHDPVARGRRSLLDQPGVRPRPGCHVRARHLITTGPRHVVSVTSSCAVWFGCYGKWTLTTTPGKPCHVSTSSFRAVS